AARLQRLDQRLAQAEDDADREATAARTARAENAELERALDAARAQLAAARPVGQVERLLASVDARRTLAELAALPGLRLPPLTALTTDAGLGGHVLWHPNRRDVVLCAFHLPPLPAGELYRVRLGLADGTRDDGTAFRPAPSGEVVLTVPAPDAARALRTI